jgi:hypothetical protein
MDGTRRQFFGQLQTAGFVSRAARLDRIGACFETHSSNVVDLFCGLVKRLKLPRKARENHERKNGSNCLH